MSLKNPTGCVVLDRFDPPASVSHSNYLESMMAVHNSVIVHTPRLLCDIGHRGKKIFRKDI